MLLLLFFFFCGQITKVSINPPFPEYVAEASTVTLSGDFESCSTNRDNYNGNLWLVVSYLSNGSTSS